MKKIDKLKNSKFARGLFAAKSAIKALPQILPLSEQNPELILKALIGKNIDKFVDDVGSFKGSILKAAQLLSSYGEYYLPKEMNDILKKVQSQSHFLAWNNIEPLIPTHFFESLNIDKEPIAAASIGQVHKALIKETSQELALKIQYPGVKNAIDLDVAILKGFISLAKVLPRKIDMSDIYEEIKRVLEHEMDYKSEVEKQKSYREIFSKYDEYYIPEIYEQYCTESIIATEYIAAKSLAQINVLELSQKQRNKIGESLFRLYFHEIFKGNLIQTDCHAGNFLLRQVDDDYQLVLIDFGACLEYDLQAIEVYRNLIKYSYFGNKDKFISLLEEVATGNGGEFIFNRDKLWDYCLLVAEPLHSEDYDWGTTTTPDKLLQMAKDMLDETHVEKPPHQFIFLDRKILGIFSILRMLKSKVNMKKLVAEVIN